MRILISICHHLVSHPAVVASHPCFSPVVCVGCEVWNLQHLGIGLVLLLIEGDPLLLVPDGTNLWREILRWTGLSTATEAAWCPGCICLVMMGRAEAPCMSCVIPGRYWFLHTHLCCHGDVGSCYSQHTQHLGGFWFKIQSFLASGRRVLRLRFWVTERGASTVLCPLI